jgi:hypothetical protein
MGQKKTLSYAEHLDIGARVKATNDLLREILFRTSKGLGTSAKASKLAYKIAEQSFQELRSQLDDLLFADCRDRPDVTPEQLKTIYYGSTKDSKVVLHRARK